MEVLSSRTIIASNNLDRARSFYEGTLGLRVYREYGSGGVVTGVVLFMGGGFLELTGGTPTAAGDAVKLWLQVPDLDGTESRLRQAGVKILKPAGLMPWGLIELWIEDPHGIEIRLIEIPPEHSIRRRLS